jgi:hypothetical protein
LSRQKGKYSGQNGRRQQRHISSTYQKEKNDEYTQPLVTPLLYKKAAITGLLAAISRQRDFFKK